MTALLLAFLLLPQQAPAADTWVCDKGCQYTSIAKAVQAAKAGAVIRVKAGSYSEPTITIDKPLTLVGEGFPVVDGGHVDDVIHIWKTDHVRIEGLVIQNCGVSYIKEMAAIKIEESHDCIITGNRLRGNNFSVYLANSDSCTISGNEIIGVPKTGVDTGNGIHIWHGSKATIQDNHISGCRDGIYFEFVTDSNISGNRVYDNFRYGLHFMFSHRDNYRDNWFTKNGAGVAVMYSDHILMEHNRFSGSSGSAAYGLLLKDIKESKITNNEFSENTVGIYMEGSNRSQIEGNVVSNNGWGLRIMGSCEGNHFKQNDFIANTFDVVTNTSFNENEFLRNHWSAYDGYDLNHDGVGDRPFRLGSLSSIIMERVDSSFILLHSLLFTLLDEVERALPELIPERLKDEQPLMRPLKGVRKS